MIGIVLATMDEAGRLIERLGACKVADEPFQTYTFATARGRSGGVIIISGMGKVHSAEAAKHLIANHQVTEMLNVGICGALSEDFAPGALVRITTVVDGDRILADEHVEPLPCTEAASDTLRPGRLASVDDPIFQDDRRSKLARWADVVDMEGLAVAQVCRQGEIRFGMIKGVSDQADSRGKAEIQTNIAPVSERLAEQVDAALSQSASKPSRTAGICRFAKIEHSIFSLPLLLAGAYLGGGGRWPAFSVLGLIVLAGVSARTLGMAMNRILDRHLDTLNARTANRELPSGRMSLAAACGVAGGAVGLYLLACAALSPICLKLSAVPVVPLVLYSLLKRFTSLCHFGIGLCLSLAPLGAFVAASGGLAFDLEVLLLAAFAFCWISGFDIIYALQDIDSDRATGVRSIPAALGAGAGQVAAAIVHLPAVAAIVWLWLLVGAGAAAGAATAIAAGAFIAAYWPGVPTRIRFFPISAVAGVAGAMVPLLGEL